jgi:hypothetical protein
MNYIVSASEKKRLRKTGLYTTLCTWLLLWWHSYFTGRIRGVQNKKAIKIHILLNRFTKISPLWLRKPIHPLAQRQVLEIIPDIRNFNWSSYILNQHFWQAPNFSLQDKKAQWDESGRRTLLADDTCGGAVMLRPIRFPCAGVWTKQDCIAYTNYIVDNIYTQLRLAPGHPERNICASRGGSVHQPNALNLPTGARARTHTHTHT